MGTSKKHMNDKIRNLLKDTDFKDIDKYAPEISRVALTKDTLSKSLDDEKTVNKSIEIITKRFVTIGQKGYKGKSKKELLEDQITLQEFLELVLEEIESETKIESKILQKSLRIVMTKLLNEDTEDSHISAQLLFYQVTYFLLEKELYETLKESYSSLSYIKIKEMVSSLSDRIMNNEVYDKINDFVDKKISLSQLLDIIIKATDDAKFGEF